MLWIFLTIFSYFAAFLAIIAIGKRKNTCADNIAIAASAVSLAAFFILLFSPALQREYISASYRISGLTFDFGFLVDKLSLLMGGIVSFVTTLVMLYSRDYMRQDPERGRFFALLSFFAGSMLGIVYSVSFAQLFIFWELVGLSSYFLIGFWWKDPVVSSSARKVFTIIVVGDVFLLLGFLVLGGAFGTLTFSEMIRQHNHIALPASGVLLVLLGAFTKSAQIPFSMWLPWAMEGPTPVSALLHAATMVKAGVFLVARILPLVFAAHLENFIIVFALLTIFTASLLALVERDIKRILAYSTVSQLGFIAFGLGLGAYGASLFHLFNDAFYKALLFLGAGVIIHAGGSRDIFALKPLHWAKEKLFLTLTVIGVFGISGLPPFNGFFSKDLIIEAAKETHNTGIYILALVAVFLSALYIARWMTLILIKTDGFPLLFAHKDELMDPDAVHDIPHDAENQFGASTKIAMSVLAIGVLGTGWIGKSFFEWLGLQRVPHYNLSVSFLSLVLIAAAFFVAHMLYVSRVVSARRLLSLFFPVVKILNAKLGLVWLYNLFARFFCALGEAFLLFDRYIIDSVLRGASRSGRTLAASLYWIDRNIIDGILHEAARATVAFCFGSHRFDISVIDGVVRSFYAMLAFASGQARKLVSGFATTYVVALVVAATFSILLLNGILVRYN